jgi:hypothetical protein
LVLFLLMAAAVAGIAPGQSPPGMPPVPVLSKTPRGESPRTKEQIEELLARGRAVLNEPETKARLEEALRRLEAGEPAFPAGTARRAAAPVDRPIETVTLSVEGFQPLLEFASQLQLRTGVPIGYEEPEWAFVGDTVRYADVPPEKLRGIGSLQMQQNRPDRRLLRRGGIEVSFEVYADTKRPPGDLHGFVGRVLEQAVADHLKRGNPGVFRVLDLGGYGFSLVAVGARDKDGVFRESVPPLDTVISFPEESRSPQATLSLIAKKMGEARGMAYGALGSFGQGQGVRLGAKAEPARDVLIRMFGSFMRMGQGALPEGYAALTQSRTWRLNYNVESGGHILYVETVTRQTPTADGPGAAQPAMLPPPIPEEVQRKIDELRNGRNAAGAGGAAR